MGQLSGFKKGNYAKDQIIIREGENSRKMYIIKTGKVKVTKQYLNKKITLAVLGPGEIFGELSFFDAKPRSASVESITDIEVVELDELDNSKEDGDELPQWVRAVFKNVFQRFRAMDEQLTLFQCMHDFQKKTSQTNTLSKPIYLELSRFVKMVLLVNEKAKAKAEPIELEWFFTEVGQLLGQQYISFKSFKNHLIENSYVKTRTEKGKELVEVNEGEMQGLINYLDKGVKDDNFIILGHTSLAIMRKMVSVLEKGDHKGTSKILKISFEELNLKAIPLYTEGIKDLTKNKVIKVDQVGIETDSDAFYLHFNYQVLIKLFDHFVFHSD